MTYRSFIVALMSGALLFSLAACDDSSTVGLGVGPDPLDGGQPQTVDALPDTFSVRVSDDGPPITSNISPSPAGGHRILTGTVTDPLVGTVTTRGHIDFRQASGVDSVSSIVSVELLLEPEYRYGSTSDQQTIDVHDATDEIEDSLRANSTALGVGPLVTSGSFVSEDTLVTISMPDSWISSNRSDLLNSSDGADDGYDARFQGLVLAPSSGNHVMGFNRSASRLRMITDNQNGERDTLNFFGSKSFTHIERSGSSSAPATSELLVSGFGEQLLTDIDFDGPPFDSLGRVPVSRAEFVIPVDSAALTQSKPANFTRPGFTGSGGFSLLLRGQLTEDRTGPENMFNGQNRLCIGLEVQTIDNSCALPIESTENGFVAVPSVFQRVVEFNLTEDEPPFSEYTLEFSGLSPSITPVLLRRPNPSSPASGARIQLTVVPQR